MASSENGENISYIFHCGAGSCRFLLLNSPREEKRAMRTRLCAVSRVVGLRDAAEAFIYCKTLEATWRRIASEFPKSKALNISKPRSHSGIADPRSNWAVTAPRKVFLKRSRKFPGTMK